jgi:hypothetical protein
MRELEVGPLQQQCMHAALLSKRLQDMWNTVVITVMWPA